MIRFLRGRNLPGIIDRLLLLASSLIIFMDRTEGTATVTVALAAITVSALNGYFKSPRFLAAGTVSCTVASLIWPALAPYLPLLYYDAMLLLPETSSSIWIITGVAVSLAACFISLPFHKFLLAALLMALSYLLAFRAAAVDRSRAEAKQWRDSSQEMSLLFEQRNKELIEKQDYEIHLATLNERGRIAREIHDHVGHLLSRSILQMGAMMALNRGTEEEKQLSTIHKTLTEAMDQIRTSVHDLHDDSLDLEAKVETLVRTFTFCPIRLNYTLEREPERETAYCLLAVIKEGLNNIIRHSDATEVTLAIQEHPSLYQLVLQDNGSPVNSEPGRGLGLLSMSRRVAELNGRLLAEQDGGFRLFATIPKRRNPVHESADR